MGPLANSRAHIPLANYCHTGIWAQRCQISAFSREARFVCEVSWILKVGPTLFSGQTKHVCETLVCETVVFRWPTQVCA